MALSAVGKMKVWVTRWVCSSSKVASGLNLPLNATISRPKYSVGSKASISPPVHAQSAGLQNTALDDVLVLPSKPNQFWLQTKPVKLPINARCGISAPFGGPVVPLV